MHVFLTVGSRGFCLQGYRDSSQIEHVPLAYRDDGRLNVSVRVRQYYASNTTLLATEQEHEFVS